MSNNKLEDSPLVPPLADPARCTLLKAGHALFSPDVWIVESTDGSRTVWKTWSRRSWIERVFLCNRFAAREARVLEVMDGAVGFPRLLSRPNKATLEMTLLDAEPVSDQKDINALSPLYFERLAAMIDLMHSRGCNHGDLRRKNLLRAPGDPSTPLLIDFTQSLYMPPPRRGPRKWIFDQAVRVDRVTLLKLKKWYLGDDGLTEEEKAEAQRIPWHLKLGRLLRKKIYRPIRRKLTGNKRNR